VRLRSSRIISGTGCITAKGCGTLSWFSLKAFSKREKAPGANPGHLNCQSGKGAYHSGSELDNRHINGHNITNWQQIPLSDVIAVEVRAREKALALGRREKALALGRKPPDPRVITLEQEAARWQKRKENKKRATQREIRMLQKTHPAYSQG